MLTPDQLAALKTAILAETDPVFVPLRTANDEQGMAAFYNSPTSPAFIVWRTDVTADETGNAWVGSDIDAMSSLNMQRLQLLLASSRAGVFDMTRADRRAGFENPFGGIVSNPSRVAMRAVWKRVVNRWERLFATGTGSDAAPGVPVVQGTITAQDISDALRY
jgi:hypothetical protein